MAVAFSVFGKKIMSSLFSKPATAMYPVLKNEFYPNTRGNLQIKAEDCIHCGMCSKRCPAQAIEVSRPDKKWEVDRSRCLVCGFCIQVCPKQCLFTEKEYTPPMTDRTKAVTTVYEPKADETATN